MTGGTRTTSASRSSERSAAETHEPLELHTRNLDLQDMNGLPTLDYVNVTGPFKAKGPGNTPSRERIFACKPADQATAESLRDRDPVEARAPRVSAPAERRGRSAADDLLRLGCGARRFRRRHPVRAAHAADEPEVPVPRRARSAQRGAGQSVRGRRRRRWRRGCRFSCGARYPTTSCWTWRRKGKLSDADVFRKQVARMLADPRAEGAREELRGAVAVPPQPDHRAAVDGRVSGLRRQRAARDAPRDRAAVRQRDARGSQRGRVADGRITRSSTTGSRSITASTACTAASSARCPSPTRTAAACLARPAS